MASNAGGIGAAKEDVDQQVPAPVAAAASTPAPPAQPEQNKVVTVEDVDDVDDVPDPDEDDLDDLDDLLDEFSSAQIGPKKPDIPSVLGKPEAVGEEPKLEDVFNDEDFAKHLQAGMADLLGEIESTPDVQAQFESIFKELGAAASEAADDAATRASSSIPAPVSGAAAAAAAAAEEATFQETIKKTMERMQASGEQATAAAAAEGSDDFMAELLRQMQGGGGGGLDGGEGNEEEFSKMLLGMMEQLTNKEILYEPMKELNDKFPGWLEKNGAKTPKDDLNRYEEQQALVKEIVARFEQPTYADSNTADREYIIERMQKMQAAGSPPPDLVGDMPSAQDVLSMPDESCNPQ
ncbi:Pex19 protein family-domain-containing protein [Lasiosphaeris hirsuta]|uniref:Pex19 protein family-domain-containing protein n=1 Tax=Lasiosphaeris hirsuta TaxID=260670 RepID=A0AA40ARK3_9PEZI|nr:Pex19 protein family-domain-containing protein [Lasiosphaeris hirsuta]